MVEGQLYGLIGRGISHSFSADFFNTKFEREGIKANYELFDLPSLSRLPELIQANSGLRGLNVTSPYKREVMKFLDEIDPAAEEIGAVNVIKIFKDGNSRILKGFNADAEGFRLTLDSLPLSSGSTAMILGSGGAASAVARALSQSNISYTVVSRHPQDGQIGYGEANAMLEDTDLVINATPLGMAPLVESCPPIDYDLIHSGQIFYDLIYNPNETLFLKKARLRGALTVNGLQMLINQANLSWEVWNR